MSKWIIVASGPSMLRVDMAALKRRRDWQLLTVNNSWKLAPWADAMFAGDLQWWDRYGDEVRGFRGERWTRDEAAALRFRLRLVRLRNGTGLCRDDGHIHAGGNSGYQAINLAYHFGARQIVLLGFDMHRNAGGHWHEEHEGMLSAPETHLPVWRHSFEALAFDLQAQGVEVVNATQGTALTAFPRRPLSDCL